MFVKSTRFKQVCQLLLSLIVVVLLLFSLNSFDWTFFVVFCYRNGWMQL